MLQKISIQKSDMSQSLSRLIRAVRIHDTFDKASREYENALKRLERDFSPAIKSLERLIQELKSLEEVFAADSNSEEATSKIRELWRTAKRFKDALISYAEDLKYYPAADPPQALERIATGVKFEASKTVSFLMKETISQGEEAQSRMTSLVRDGLVVSVWGVCIAILAGSVVAFVLTKSLSTPIKRLIRGTEEVARGNLNHKIEVKSKDEMGQLANTFNSMISGLREKVQFEDALKSSEEKYRNISEHSNDGICIVQDTLSQEALLKYANRQIPMLLGYSLEEIIEKPFMSLVHPDELQSVKEKYEQFVAGVAEQRYETALQHKAGYRIEVEFNISATDHGNREAALICLRDITERKRAAEALQKAHDELEQRVEERSVELVKTNDELRREIQERRRVEKALQKSEVFLQELVAEQTHEIELTQRTSIEALATLAEYSDTDTGAHLKRIQAFVRLLATHLMEDSPYSTYLKDKPSYIDELVFASLLHDIGKTAIPENILTKPGKLTDEEFELIKNHTTVAGEMLQKANRLFVDEFGKDSYLALARDIAHYHHEKWNGRGYPRGLSGESIPLSARIVALADVYDALTSKRPYKEPWSHEDAAKEIQQENGQHFDPNVVSAFTAVSEKFRELSQAHDSPVEYHTTPGLDSGQRDTLVTTNRQ
jgi:PAS domain S-box-containing protein